MIIVMRPDHQEEDLLRIVRRLEDMSLRAHISKGEHRTIVGAIGDERILAEIPMESFPGSGEGASHLKALQAGQQGIQA